jgi:DNA (cytosine-5)-methyltransferase 1
MPLDFAHKTYFLDLFSGIGGFSLGAYWAGLRFDGHYFSEVDDYAIRVYQQRFPDSEGLGDIRNIRAENLPLGDYIIAGGFPCQDISVAGKGAGLEGERSGLWYEYARLISELRPRYAIMENVGALAFRGLDSVLGSLAEIGYDAEWQDIRASDVGAPHRRERIWIVAYPREERKQGSKSQEIQREPALPRSENIGKVKDMFRRSDLFEPKLLRANDGLSYGMDRLACLGNSIVPQIAELIFRQPPFDEWRQDA